jgi:hypothetical protein
MPAEVPRPGEEPDRTLNLCPPYLDAITSGYIIPLSGDLIQSPTGMKHNAEIGLRFAQIGVECDGLPVGRIRPWLTAVDRNVPTPRLPGG